MNKEEETLTAIQNIGVSVFVCGIIGECMAVTPITLMICAGAVVLGGVIATVAGWKLDKLEEWEERTGEENGRKKAS